MSSALELDAAILCGGLGTRLRGAVPEGPKCLAPVGGRPFLERLLRQLDEVGCRRVVLCTGVGAAAVRAFCAGRTWRFELGFSEEATPLGTAGALALARGQLRGDPVAALNGDSIVPGLDWGAFAGGFQSSGAAGGLVVVPADERADAGALALGAGGRLTSFAEKSRTGGFFSAGIYLFRQRLLGELGSGASSLEHDWLPRWLGAGLYGYVHPGPMVDIGTPERWEEAQRRLQ